VKNSWEEKKSPDSTRAAKLSGNGRCPSRPGDSARRSPAKTRQNLVADGNGSEIKKTTEEEEK